MEVDDLKRTMVIKGIGVSSGIVIGKAYLFDRFDAQVPLYHLAVRPLSLRRLSDSRLLSRKRKSSSRN